MITKFILEAINRGIKLALDDYEDIENNNLYKNDIIDADKDGYKNWDELQDNKRANLLVSELIDIYANVSLFTNAGALGKHVEQRTIEIFNELDKIYKKWGRFLFKRKIESNNKANMGQFTSPTGTLKTMIRYISSFVKNCNLNWVDVSNKTNLSNLFLYAKFTSLNISDWDVSHVTNMSEMFYGCVNLRTCDLSKWDVSNVTDMRRMFSNCQKFNGRIEKWNVSNVTIMAGMFLHCYKFNRNISNWNVSNVTHMGDMFYNCVVFDQPIGKWNLENVKDTEDMLQGCTLFVLNLSSWQLSDVKDIREIAKSSGIEDIAFKKLWPKFIKKK